MKQKLIELMKFYQDPAEDLNHGERGNALFDFHYETVADEFLSDLIDELVSDEEIEEKSREGSLYPSNYDIKADYFVLGAKWMRDKLTNKE